MSDVEFDFVIIGAGIVGSWTAKELVKYGKVLLLEQFREPHTRGSSHGQTRLIFSGYGVSCLAEIMPHAFRMWKQVEEETNEKLIETTGALYIADSPDNKDLTDSINNMKRFCPENLVELTSSDIKSKYSETLKYDDGCGVIFDRSSGIIFAHKALETIQKLFQNSGGLLWDSCKVTEIIPQENKILVKTCKHDVFTKSLVVTSGAWTKQVLSKLEPSLPLQPQMVKVRYWKEKKKDAYSAASGFPAVIDYGCPCIYSLPSFEYPGFMKVCLHGGVPCDPDERDKAIPSEEQENIIREYVKDHFPLLETEPAIIETCMYTFTPDGLFLIDRLPKYKNIVIGAGFSGTGFKTSPVVGRLLSELARGENTFLDVSPYRLSRFTKM